MHDAHNYILSATFDLIPHSHRAIIIGLSFYCGLVYDFMEDQYSHHL